MLLTFKFSSTLTTAFQSITRAVSKPFQNLKPYNLEVMFK